MGSLKSLALAGVMVMSASAIASAADFPYPAPPPPPHEPLGLKGSIGGGWYLRGDVGVSATNYGDLEVKSDNRPVGSVVGVSAFSTKKSETSFGAFAGIGIGYQFNSYLRFDLTGDYRGGSLTGRDHIAYNFGTATQQTNSYRADIASFVGLANAYIDLGTWNCLTPYLGAGVGFAHHTVNGFTDNGLINQGGVDVATSFGYADSASKTTVAWALMAGVSYDVTSNLKLELGYRYLNMGDAPVMGLRGGNSQLLANPSSSVRFKELDSHDIRIGMRWNFSDSDCCGPKERPVAYAPQPVVRKF